MKIYCKDCMYLDSSNNWDLDVMQCSHSNNIRNADKNKWYAFDSGWENIELPSEINKNNDCRWYKNKYTGKGE